MNEIDQDPPSQFFVSTDAALLDVVWITRTIQQTYFGAWRSDAVILRSLAPPSICFGLYESATSKQVGFARVVSDCATFRQGASGEGPRELSHGARHPA